MLTFQNVSNFLDCFPSAKKYIKQNNPNSPCIGIQVNPGREINISKSGWVNPWDDISNPVIPGKKLILVNIPIGECYPCEVSQENGNPVGYLPSNIQSLGEVIAYETRDANSPLLTIEIASGAICVDGDYAQEGDVIFVRLQDGTIGLINPRKLNGMKVLHNSPVTAKAISFDSEPIWASAPLVEDREFIGLEGAKLFPIGSRVCFSDTKNVYFITSEKWTKMGYNQI